MKETIIKLFNEIFNYTSEGNLYFSPGRVNLIGEHTDYTGGLVLPFGIDQGTYIYAVKNNSSKINIYSDNFKDGIISIETESLMIKKSHWTDYFKAVLYVLSNDSYTLSSGFDAVIAGNIPDSAGLSSSASFEMVSMICLLDQNGYTIPQPGSEKMVELSLKGQQAENQFIGLQCGIMDQFACANAKKGQAIELNCDTLSFQYAPLETGEYEILVINTNKKRRLEESKYNERRLECEKGFELLKKLGITEKKLGNVCLDKYNSVKDGIHDELLKKRLDHVIQENERVKKAVENLKNNDIIGLAKQINVSGDSLREKYEVTGFHLDLLVDIARSTEGVIASRMTGAGFGGCTVNIVQSGKLEQLCNTISIRYTNDSGIKPDFYSFKAGNGSCKLF